MKTKKLMKSNCLRPVLMGTMVTLLVGCGGGDGETSMVSSSALAAPPPAGAVATQSGYVKMVTNSDHVAVLGIPYAAPPTGENRWKAPKAPASWTGVREASVLGASCPQGTAADQTEDCLFLNVYTPDVTKKLPVMIWIHGGQLTAGSGNTDGSRLAVNQNVVVVTINYRLGQLGFLATEGLATESSAGASGNYGLMDQQLAFKWVKDNISNFGGDPANVTLVANSAGTESVCMHLMSPPAAGLFQKAILESGPCKETAQPQTFRHAHGEAIIAALGCSNADAKAALACIRGKSVSEVLAVQSTVARFQVGNTVLRVGVTIDRATVPSKPYAAYSAGNFNKVPLIMGYNKTEGAQLGLFGAVDQLGAAFTQASQYTSVLAVRYGSATTAIANAYPLANYASPQLAYGTTLGDSDFSCPGRAMIGQLASHQDRPVYAYEFSDPNGSGPVHGAETALVFQASTLNAAQLSLSNRIQAYWGNFARAGNPNGTGLATWDPYGSAKVFLNLSSAAPGLVPISDADFSAQHKCEVWSAALGI